VRTQPKPDSTTPRHTIRHLSPNNATTPLKGVALGVVIGTTLSMTGVVPATAVILTPAGSVLLATASAFVLARRSS
jgi:hypothetical protein